jgi:hypothetical protein
MRSLVEQEFKRGAGIKLAPFPNDGESIEDSPRLTLVVMPPDVEWTGSEAQRQQFAEWTEQRGKSSRLYPAALVWCLKKAGRELREKVELWLAWKRVAKEVSDGTLGEDFAKSDRAEIQTSVTMAEEAAHDEVWGGYRFVVLADRQEADGLRVIDLGAGHASGAETLSGRVIAALKAEALLNESVGAGYIERNWPPALKESGAWPLASLRQSFLNGALTRLIDPDAVLRGKIVEFVSRGDFGLSSGARPDGTYDRVWYEEIVAPDEVTFDAGVFLLTRAKAKSLKEEPSSEPVPAIQPGTILQPAPGVEPQPISESEPSSTLAAPVDTAPVSQTICLRLVGTVPPEMWNRLGTKLLPKLRSSGELKLGMECVVRLNAESARTLAGEIKQILADLGLEADIRIEQSEG